MNQQTKVVPLSDCGIVAIYTKSKVLKIIEPSFIEENGYIPPQCIALSKYAAKELRDFLNGLDLE